MTTKLTRIKSALRESIEIADKATEGPWESDGISVWSGETHVCYTTNADEDSELISHARTMTPLACKALLTAIEGLESCQTYSPKGDDAAYSTLLSITSEWPDA